MKNTIQHYLKKKEPCDVAVDHSLVVSRMKNGHISLYISLYSVVYSEALSLLLSK